MLLSAGGRYRGVPPGVTEERTAPLELITTGVGALRSGSEMAEAILVGAPLDGGAETDGAGAEAASRGA